MRTIPCVRPWKKWNTGSFPVFPFSAWTDATPAPISEGDLLWGLKRLNIIDVKEMEDIPIMAIPRRATYKAVHADADMEDLLDRAINQNYVPVVDDQGFFIGIITRKEIIKYCYKELKTIDMERQKLEDRLSSEDQKDTPDAGKA